MTMKFPKLISRMLRRAAPGEGVYRSRVGVLEVGRSEARLVSYGRAEHIVRISNDDRLSWVVTLRSDLAGPKGDTVMLSHDRSFAVSEATAAVRFYSDEVRKLERLNRDAPRRGGAFVWTLGGAAAVLAVGMLLTPTQPQAAMEIGAAAGLTQSQPESVRAAEQLLAQLAGGGSKKDGGPEAPAKLTPREVDQVQKAKSIDVRPAAVQLVAFSDPLCPSCKELDVEVEKLPNTTGFKVVPVGFQDGAREVAAAVLCSKDPKAAWVAALRGQKPNEAACEAGLQAVDENNRLFTAIGATATPTLMAPNGTVAAGSTDAKTLAVFVGMNGK
jgi:protein-disulfide isomerase